LQFVIISPEPKKANMKTRPKAHKYGGTSLAAIAAKTGESLSALKRASIKNPSALAAAIAAFQRGETDRVLPSRPIRRNKDGTIQAYAQALTGLRDQLKRLLQSVHGAYQWASPLIATIEEVLPNEPV
jgi:hypothetical protein